MPQPCHPTVHRYTRLRPNTPVTSRWRQPYNESLWLVGAMGTHCRYAWFWGRRLAGTIWAGGCGRCPRPVIVAARPLGGCDEEVKVSRETNLCGSNNTLHVDVAVPGFDYLSESIANVCGNPTRLATFITKNDLRLAP